MTKSLELVDNHIPGMINLLANSTVTKLNDELRNVFDELATRYLSRESESRLSERLRKYDNFQRLAFGRASSAPMANAELTSGLDLADLRQIANSTQDPGCFPTDLASSLFRPLNDTLRHSIHTLISRPEHMDAQSVVSIFCNRVVVRPQEEYAGFFHRDLAPQGDLAQRRGQIGTMTWYPEVRDSLIEGLEFIAFENSQDVLLAELSRREPDYVIKPSQYKQRAIVLGYPQNYAHGVRAGRNPVQSFNRKRAAFLTDFISPPKDCFLKDMVTIVVSSIRPIAT